jgi:hypothetical protein
VSNKLFFGPPKKNMKNPLAVFKRARTKLTKKPTPPAPTTQTPTTKNQQHKSPQTCKQQTNTNNNIAPKN